MSGRCGIPRIWPGWPGAMVAAIDAYFASELP